VLGPSTDGGYYLLGLKTAHRRLFEEIDWSTERVAAQTLQRARELGLPVHILPHWYDVDELDALKTLWAELCAARAFDPRLPSYRPRQTAAMLHGLLRDTDLSVRLGLTPAGAAVEALG
jgi:hypothetical protein